MLSKFILLTLMCIVLMGASNCSGIQYAPPMFEDCTVLTKWSEDNKTDVATCFCLDDRLNLKYFDQVLILRVNTVLKAHPLLASALEYLNTNKEVIIKNREYELPVSYCRGYSAVSPTDRTSITKWAEEQRVERIRCELEQPMSKIREENL